MNILIDTNVLSEVTKRSPNAGVPRWLGGAGRVGMSAVSLEELYFGLALRPNANVQRVLERYVDSFCTVYPLTAGIAKHAGTLRGQLGRLGQVRTQSDMLIAATAVAHGLTLATRNTRDFEGCGVALLNPFTS
jgi:predicted nucleic acid-binding protein